MTSNTSITNDYDCPGHEVLNILSTKWVPNIFKAAHDGPVRFSGLMKNMPYANKQSISSALHKMKHHGLLHKTVVKQKPLHIQYELSDKGRSALEVFRSVWHVMQHDKEQKK
jgi:DNA-binding HxlR family transcriptional regulator